MGKKGVIINLILILMASSFIFGCGTEEVVELSIAESTEACIIEFAEISEDDYYSETITVDNDTVTSAADSITGEMVTSTDTDSATTNSETVELNLSDDSVSSEDVADTMPVVDDNDDQRTVVSAASSDGIEAMSITDAYYGYSASEINNLTVAMLCNDKLGYARSTSYTQSNMKQFVPFKSGSSELSYFHDYFMNKKISEIEALARDWNNLGEKQRLALGGFVYSGLIPSGVFVGWGVNYDDIFGYAQKISRY